jgi:hypothetical protein
VRAESVDSAIPYKESTFLLGRPAQCLNSPADSAESRECAGQSRAMARRRVSGQPRG